MAEACARALETHTAWLFFAGDRVYKVKKPVHLGFLDFRSVEARARACADEVALNRRLSPDVYLGVAEIRGPDGCEHAVVMRRMPDELRLGHLLRTRTDLAAEVDQIASLLARFHSDAQIPDDAANLGSARLLRARWDDGLDLLERTGVVPSADVQETRRLAHRYLAGRQGLLRARVTAGRVRDGHGDLLTDDIFCLPEGPRILDCLEFDRELRIGDTLADVTFLAMDLEHQGAPAYAQRLLDRYAALSNDRWPRSLEHHYVAHRAHIRAKVSAIRAGQTTGEESARAAAESRKLTSLGLRHLQVGRVRMLVIGGLPGAGKSTVATAVAGRTGWPVLSSDIVRKQLAGLPALVPAGADFRNGIYTSGWSEAAYAEMFEQASRHLEMGESVILDASFTDPLQRQEAAALARRTSTDLVEVSLLTLDVTAEARIATRRPGETTSDATIDVRRRLAEYAEPWPSAHGVRSDTALEETVAQVAELLR
jgi:aminoglycoside phosphotransferase family enzyme/predicted kinase